MNNKIAIVGSNPISRGNAPWDDTTYDILVFNEAGQYDWATRVTHVIQIHKPLRYMRKHNAQHSRHWEWLQQRHNNLVILMQDVDPLIPNSVRFPRDEIIDKLNCENYFTSTMCYAIAWAIYSGYKVIELFGVEVASGTEYQYQRDGVAYWVGFAQGYPGVEFNRFCAGNIFIRPKYGYEGGVYHTPEEFIDRRNTLKAIEAETIERKLKADSGMESAFDDIENLPDFITRGLDANIELGKIRGKIYEIERYLMMVEEMYQLDNMAYISRSQFEMTMKEAKFAAEQKAVEIYRTAGRMDYVFMAWQQTKDPRAVTQIRDFTMEHLKAGYESGYQQGRMMENEILISLYDMRLQASGEDAV